MVVEELLFSDEAFMTSDNSSQIPDRRHSSRITISFLAVNCNQALSNAPATQKA
jgi:hypothetical protein